MSTVAILPCVTRAGVCLVGCAGWLHDGDRRAEDWGLRAAHRAGDTWQRASGTQSAAASVQGQISTAHSCLTPLSHLPT